MRRCDASRKPLGCGGSSLAIINGLPPRVFALSCRLPLSSTVPVPGTPVMPQFHIRRLQPEDHAAFRDIRLEGLRLHPEAFGASLEEEERLSPEEIAGRIGRSVIFGGFDADERLAGVIGLAR